jgi:hypothetical protein
MFVTYKGKRWRCIAFQQHAACQQPQILLDFKLRNWRTPLFAIEWFGARDFRPVCDQSHVMPSPNLAQNGVSQNLTCAQ